MSLPSTPQKKVDEIELIKQGLASRYGLALHPHDLSWSPSKSHANSIADKINSQIQFLYYRGKVGSQSPPLNEVLQAFDKHAPTLVSQWVFKPAGDADVVPSPTSGHRGQRSFLSRRDALSDRDQQVLMDCLYNKLCNAAEALKLKLTTNTTTTSFKPKIPMSIEQSEAMPPAPLLPRSRPNSENPNAAPAFASKAKSQAKINMYFRNRSAPNPSPSSSSDEFSTQGIDFDTVMDDFEPPMLNPPSNITDGKEVGGSPPEGQFHTPPTTPGSPFKATTSFENDGTMKPPSMVPIQRKRANEDDTPTLQPRKVSRESTRRAYKPLTRSLTEPNIDDTPSSSQRTDATKISFSTMASSNVTSPNTSFTSDAYSALSRNTSFDFSSDTDVTVRQPIEKSFTDNGPRCDATDQDTSPDTTGKAVQNLIETFTKSSPFGEELPPKFLDISFRQLYEVVRVALACDLDLSNFSSVLRVNYEDYDRLWARLRTIVQSKNCMIPEASSKKAWELAAPTLNNVAFGGKLSLGGQLGKPLLRLRLSPLKVEDSHRLWRKFGGDRFFCLKVPAISRNTLPEYLKSDVETVHTAFIDWLTYTLHSFLGRRWQVFFGREDRSQKPSRTISGPKERVYRIHMFAEDGHDFIDRPRFGEADPRGVEHVRMSALDLIGWFMSADRNMRKPALKLFARLALAVSKTIPTYTFRSNQIFHVRDAYASTPGPSKIDPNYSQQRKQTSDVQTPDSPIMNDGCARMSRAAARAVSDHLGLLHVPCAFQGRFGGAKGMWMVDVTGERPTPQAGDIWIEISESQLKFEGHYSDLNPYTLPDPNRVTFEVNDYIKSLSSSGLNFQLMPILEHGGVPVDVFKQIVRDDQTSQISSMQAAMDAGVSLRLWNQRHNAIEERLQGQAMKMCGGIPQVISQKIEWAVECGFEPESCRFLRDMLYRSIHAYCLRLEEKMDVKIGQSTFPFMLADPLGILEEGEVHLGFSSSFSDPKSGFDDTMIHDRDVLVARMPAHLPSDIQRVRAVFRTELRAYRDVIIFSVKGACSLASKLSGGDYDGDRAWVCWDPSIVNKFTNTEPPPETSAESFGIQKDSAKVSDFVKDKRFTKEFIRHGLDFNLRPSMLGTCTSFHEKFCYNDRPINDPEAVKIAQLLGLLVDSAKGGFTFTEAVWGAYLKDNGVPLGGRKPAYKDQTSSKPTKHLIDVLVFEVAKGVKDDALEHFSNRYKEVDIRDDDLIRYKVAELKRSLKGADLKAVLSSLNLELEAIFNEWSRRSRANKEDFRSLRVKTDQADLATVLEAADHCRSRFLAIAPSAHETGLPIQSDRIQEWQEQHAAGEESYWDLLKASIAYSKFPKSNFVWYLAGMELGEIKATSKGRAGYRTVQIDIHRVLRVNGRLVDGMKKREDLEAMYETLANAAESDDDDGDDASDFGSSSWVNGISF